MNYKEIISGLDSAAHLIGMISPRRLKQNPGDDKWYRIYFEQRRRYESRGLFAVQRINI